MCTCLNTHTLHVLYAPITQEQKREILFIIPLLGTDNAQELWWGPAGNPAAELAHAIAAVGAVGSRVEEPAQGLAAAGTLLLVQRGLLDIPVLLHCLSKSPVCQST